MPLVVIAPPFSPVPPVIEDTVALEVLHVPEPVIAPVPFPVRQPVKVAAPVPPFVTGSVPVRKLTPIELEAESKPLLSALTRPFVMPVNHTEEVAVNCEELALVKF